jgi:PAS domain S-box-containing protein
MPNANIETPDWLRQMESILEELNEGVAILDDTLRLIFANEALIRLGQYGRDELRGRTPEALFPPEDIPYIMREHELGHLYGRNRSEFYFPRKDGKKIPVIFSGRVIRASDGQNYVLVTVTDISEQKRVEERLRKSNALLEERQTQMEAELALATRVQRTLAPQNSTWDELSIEACYLPVHTIGGDFGVVLPQGHEFLNLILCDVSGHGVGSALMANRIYSETLHALDGRTGPGTLLRRLHDFVHDRIPVDGFYFTMSATRFSRQGHRVTFAAGGHPPAILLSNGVPRLLHSQSGILGCLAETAPSDSSDELDLLPGDRLVLYTDGLVEVFNHLGEMLDVEGLSNLVCQASKGKLPEMRQAILDGVAAWSHGPLTDDLSLVIVEVR